MVLESLQQPLYSLTLILALITAVLGMILLNGLFKDKMRDLFRDVTFFIFFFLIAGYILSALAELLWYLIYTVFGESAGASMPDFYWVTGSLLILISFATLAITLSRQHQDINKFPILLVIGVALVAIMLIYTSMIGLAGRGAGNLFLGYFYPISTALIVTFSMSAYFYRSRIAHFGRNLLWLFFASVAYLIADMAYVYTTVQGYGPVGVLSDVMYIAAYGLSALSFLMMLLKVHDVKLGDLSL